MDKVKALLQAQLEGSVPSTFTSSIRIQVEALLQEQRQVASAATTALCAQLQASPADAELPAVVSAEIATLCNHLKSALQARHEHVAWQLQDAVGAALGAQLRAANATQVLHEEEAVRTAAALVLGTHLESELNSYHSESVRAVVDAVNSALHGQLAAIGQTRQQQATAAASISALRADILAAVKAHQQQATEALTTVVSIQTKVRAMIASCLPS
jgi:hypothetical protein